MTLSVAAEMSFVKMYRVCHLAEGERSICATMYCSGNSITDGYYKTPVFLALFSGRIFISNGIVGS